MSLGQSSFKLGTDGRAEGSGEGLAEALHIGVGFRFDHDAGKRFGAGIAQNDAAIFAERVMRFSEGARNLGKLFERGCRTDFDVHDDLGIVLESLDERFERAVPRNK